MVGRKRTVISDEMEEKIIDWREQGKSCHWIAERLGIPTATIYSHCLTWGIESPRTRAKVLSSHTDRPLTYVRGNQVVRRYTPNEDQIIQSMRVNGETCTEIAKHLDRKPGSIRRRLCTLARNAARMEEAANV